MPTFDQIFSGGNLVRTYQEIPSGIQHNLPPRLLQATARGDRDILQYIQYAGTRQVAKQVQYGAKSRSVLPKGAKKKTVNMIHAFETETITTDLIARLQSDDENVQRLAVDQLMGDLANYRERLDNLRIAAIHSLLCLGKIHFDGDGNILPSASGAVVTIDFEVPAANQGQLNIDGNGASIGASWATVTTNIPAHVRDIKKTQARVNGYQLRHAFYGPNLPGYLFANNFTKDLIVNNPASNTAFSGGEIPNGFLGLDWHALDGAYFEDQDEAVQSFEGDDALILIPEIEDSWYALGEGTYPVPGTLTMASVQDVLDSVMTARGMFAYGTLETDPVSISLKHGDTFLPCLRNPNAILIGDVTP